MSITHINNIPAQVVKAGDLTTIQVLIPAQERLHFAKRRFVMEPGGGMPNHTNTVELEQYLLGGHAMRRIGDEEFEVRGWGYGFHPGRFASLVSKHRLGEF